MSTSRLMRQDAQRRYIAFSKEYYAKLLHSVYNECRIYDVTNSNSMALSSKRTGFKYTFFLSFKRELHSTRSTQVRCRCMYYGRARAVLMKYKMSRFAFKKLARNGDLNGITKASW